MTLIYFFSEFGWAIRNIPAENSTTMFSYLIISLLNFHHLLVQVNGHAFYSIKFYFTYLLIFNESLMWQVQNIKCKNTVNSWQNAVLWRWQNLRSICWFDCFEETLEALTWDASSSECPHIEGKLALVELGALCLSRELVPNGEEAEGPWPASDLVSQLMLPTGASGLICSSWTVGEQFY